MSADTAARDPAPGPAAPAREADAAAVLRSLAAAVREGTLLAWAIEHAPDGRDPLAEAWAACDDLDAMVEVRHALRLGIVETSAGLLGATVWRDCAGRVLSVAAALLRVEGTTCRLANPTPDACDALRAAVPPPSLAALLPAAREASRG